VAGQTTRRYGAFRFAKQVTTQFDFSKVLAGLANVAFVSLTTDADDWAVLLRMTVDEWRVLLPTRVEESEATLLSDSFIEAKLQQILRDDAQKWQAMKVTNRVIWKVHERVVDRLVDGRVALAGDAAHLNSPLGGMGMNGGIHDAFALTDALFLVLRRQLTVDEGLGRYHRQRWTVNHDAIRDQTLRRRSTDDSLVDESKRQSELMRIAANPELATQFLLKTSGIQSLRQALSID